MACRRVPGYVGPILTSGLSLLPIPVRLNRSLRRWGATLLAVAYLFGLLGPAIAFAHADRDAVIHVLTEAHGGTLTLHVHGHHEQHDPAGKTGSTPGAKLVHHCCGVTSLFGLKPDAAIIVTTPMLTRLGFAAATTALSGRASGRLDRPPRYLLPV